jgi:NDP-sugar pyrophosphorylase family protein
MTEFFKNKAKTSCIILCGGKGTRFMPLSIDKQKGMIEVAGKPILGHIIDYWKQYCSEFIFIVSYKKEDIIAYAKKLGINAKFIEETEIKGIANAITLAKDSVSDNFVVVLGDCICKGKFEFPKNMEMGFGVCITDNDDDIRRSFSVETKGNFVTKVVEKPQVLPNNYCGMGFYFFNRNIFRYIKETPQSKINGLVQITDCLQTAINNNVKMSPVFFYGDYLNMTNVYDIERAEKILKEEHNIAVAKSKTVAK